MAFYRMGSRIIACLDLIIFLLVGLFACATVDNHLLLMTVILVVDGKTNMFHLKLNFLAIIMVIVGILGALAATMLLAATLRGRSTSGSLKLCKVWRFLNNILIGLLVIGVFVSAYVIFETYANPSDLIPLVIPITVSFFRIAAVCIVIKFMKQLGSVSSTTSEDISLEIV